MRAIEHLLTSEVAGPVNLTAPSPVANADFTKILGRVLDKPTVLPVPGFGLKLLLGAGVESRDQADQLGGGEGGRLAGKRGGLEGWRQRGEVIEPRDGGEEDAVASGVV